MTSRWRMQPSDATSRGCRLRNETRLIMRTNNWFNELNPPTDYLSQPLKMYYSTNLLLWQPHNDFPKRRLSPAHTRCTHMCRNVLDSLKPQWRIHCILVLLNISLKDQLMLRISDEFEVLLLTRPQSTDMRGCFTMQGLLRKSVGLLE